jgi:hypothetical protein
MAAINGFEIIPGFQILDGKIYFDTAGVPERTA